MITDGCGLTVDERSTINADGVGVRIDIIVSETSIMDGHRGSLVSIIKGVQSGIIAGLGNEQPQIAGGKRASGVGVFFDGDLEIRRTGGDLIVNPLVHADILIVEVVSVGQHDKALITKITRPSSITDTNSASTITMSMTLSIHTRTC